MKKLLSILIALTIVISAVPCAMASNNYDSAQSFAAGVGIIDGDFNKEDVVTRGKFADIITKLLKVSNTFSDDDWKNAIYGEDSSSTVEIDINDEPLEDVDVSHPYYYQIKYLYNRGYMKGISQKRFAPEQNIILEDAVDVLLNMMGYSDMKKLDANIADKLGMMSGIKISQNEAATVEALIRLIYNSLDIKVMETKVLSVSDIRYVESEKSFMQAVLKMDKVTAVMIDNGYTSYYGKSNINKNNIQVGNVVVEIEDKDEYVRDFIGKKVHMYYTIDDDDSKLVFAQISSSDKSVSFDISDFESFDGKHIKYQNNKKTISRSFEDNIYLIVNGEAVKEFDESIFKFDSGEVTLSSISGNRYDVINIKKYEYAVVQTKNTEDGLLYNRIRDSRDTSLNVIDISEDGEYEDVFITDISSNKMSIADISVNDVLNIRRNSKQIYIIVSGEKKESVRITSTGEDDDGRTISDGENEYKIAGVYERSAAAVDFIAGNVYTLYLNAFGDVVWGEKISGGEMIGILTKVIYDEDEEIDGLRMIQFFTDEGKMVKYYSDKKIKVNGKSVKFVDVKSELEEELGTPMLLKVNDSGIVESITTPESFGNFGDRGWYVTAPKRSYSYSGNGNDFSRMMYYKSGQTGVFTVPSALEDFADERNFSYNTYAFTNNKSETVAGYSRSKYSMIPDIMVVTTDKVQVGATASYNKIFVIDSIRRGINQEDSEIMILDGYDITNKTATKATLNISEDCVMVERIGGEVDSTKPAETVGPRTCAELASGDVIRYKLDSATNEAVSIRIAYDCSTGERFNCGIGDDIHTNGNANGTTYAGYALSKDGTGLRMTIGKLMPSMVDYKNISKITENIMGFNVTCSNAIIVVESKNGGKKKIRKGSMEDIITYEDTGSDAESDRAVILAHWSAEMLGVVIYKNN